MAFSEEIINKVKELSDFRCCRCKHISFEVHHIIPQKDNGPDTLDNAAPLCPNCHADFGDNPRKRKEITQMRDLWYRRVGEMYSQQPPVQFGVLNSINSKLEALAHNQDKALIDLKETLKKVAIETIENMTAGTAQVTASGIANASVSPSASLSPSASPFPSPSPSFGGDAGSIFITSEKISGSGSISADGGKGDIGGRGGKVHIETVENKFKGKISADGGDSKSS